ncbi:hypothetical protein GYA44_02950 [Candidatus Microgenomates bacterium]|nr:hypothetical protein [Candidatus Microgenomates bacterium]
MAKTLENLLSELNKDKEVLEYSELKEKYLSKNGLLTVALQKIREIPNEEKAAYGKEINYIKEVLNEALEEKSVSKETYSTHERIDPTAPFDINSKNNF